MSSNQDQNFLGQSQIGSVLLNEFDDTPEAMETVIRKYLQPSQPITHGDIAPLFEDVTVVLIQWIARKQEDKVRDFLGRLHTLLLNHPGFEIPSVALTPEKHLLHKFSTLAEIMRVALVRQPIK